MKHFNLARYVYGIVAVLAVALFATNGAVAQDWKPGGNVEIIVGASPGGSFDITARSMQHVFQDTKLVDATVSVVNKPGGNNALSWIELNKHAGSGDYLALAFPTILTNKLLGRSPITFTDVTPIALLYTDYIAFGVKADSPLKTAKDIAAALRKDPKSVSFGLTAVGTAHQIAVASLAAAAGADPKDLKFVVFKGAGNATTAVLGGHIDVVVTSPASLAKYLEAGTMNVPLVTSPQRLSGAMSSVPTLKEQGYDIVVTNWRGMVGPKKMSEAQRAYWEKTFKALSQNSEWQKLLERYGWGNHYMNSHDFKIFLEQEREKYRTTFTALKLLK
jgi:putative tricarboxylic transport membrane protein